MRTRRCRGVCGFFVVGSIRIRVDRVKMAAVVLVGGFGIAWFRGVLFGVEGLGVRFSGIERRYWLRVFAV